MYQKTNQILDPTPLKTYLVGLPVGDYLLFKKQIKDKCEWDRQKWYRIFHGQQNPSPAEKIIISEILKFNPWEGGKL